jgi:hypothetical protein
MAGKYADRFRVGPSAAQPDVLDLGTVESDSRHYDDVEGDESDLSPLRGPRWYESWPARLAVIGALVVGITGGAVGWDRWQSYQADVASRRSVDVFASATMLSYPAQAEIAIAVRYRNDGEHVIVLRNISLDSDRVVVLGEPRDLTIEPGATNTVTMSLRADCQGDRAPVEPPQLAVEVETVDGVVSHQMIDSNFGSDIVAWLGYACEAGSYEVTFADSYAEVVATTPSADGTSLEARVVVGYGEDDELMINEVAALTSAFTVTYALDDEPRSKAFTLTYRVNQCPVAQQASDLDMSVRVSGAYKDSPAGEITVSPTATLAAELVRLTDRSCPL